MASSICLDLVLNSIQAGSDSYHTDSGPIGKQVISQARFTAMVIASIDLGVSHFQAIL